MVYKNGILNQIIIKFIIFYLFYNLESKITNNNNQITF